jgi:hypothetical protein
MTDETKPNRQVVSISVPQAMRERMQAIDGVNWSAVARNAIEKCLSIEELRMAAKMTAVERIRLSKKESREASLEAGRTAGVEWVRDNAGYTELERLHRFTVENGQDFDQVFETDRDDNFAAAEQFVKIVSEPDDRFSDHDNAEEFWTRVCGDGQEWHNPVWVRGFAIGAAANYAEIRDEI